MCKTLAEPQLLSRCFSTVL